ncbi:elongation factor Ts [Patescibacteria group bacterium]|nr:elongation factor Ts [Patescibacteria group bacterium]
MITAQDVQKLRQLTGAGMMDAKKALTEASGDLEKATDILRKKGGKIAMSRGARATGQGLVESYIHAGGQVGSMVEVLCETDFVARTDQFKELVHDLAMQVTASSPLFLSTEDVPAEVVEREKRVYQEQLATEGKTGDMLVKIIEGKIQKYYQEICLLEQPFFKDDKLKVKDVVTEAIARTGENIKIKRFCRFELAGPGVTCTVKE